MDDVPQTYETDDQQTALDRCAKLRFPTFPPDATPREKVERLESYLIETAVVEGEVQEMRLAAYRQLAACEAAWSLMTGWENHTRRPSAQITAAERDAAKGRKDPELAEALRVSKWTVQRAGEAIERLDRETKRVSRLYTMLTGG